MRRLVTLLVIVGVVYGVYNFTIAAYGWFMPIKRLSTP